MKVEIKERENHKRIEIHCEDENHTSFDIIATEKGIDVTVNYDNGDMIVKPKTGNNVLITVVDNVRI